MRESEQVTRNNARAEAVDIPLSKAAGPASAARPDGIFLLIRRALRREERPKFLNRAKAVQNTRFIFDRDLRWPCH